MGLYGAFSVHRYYQFFQRSVYHIFSPRDIQAKHYYDVPQKEFFSSFWSTYERTHSTLPLGSIARWSLSGSLSKFL